ncbi:MAG: MFS transporter [Caulobacter sp.]|jgi:MFS family permease|nr:MFS transporter [Caulobacter sp.]
MTDQTATPPVAPDVQPVSSGYRSYALWLMLGIYTLNFLDRQVVNILAEPIKQDLGLKDWQLGALTGLAFAVFYTFLGIPIARLADRANRPMIIAGALAIWSAFTVACGLAGNFVHLLLARIGVGVGEAGCSPPSHSLITDYTPKEKRASALAFYSMGIPLGSLAGMALGGLVADAHGWRIAFFVAGAPGILLAVIAALTLKEPRKALAAAQARQATAGSSFGEAMKELGTKRSFWLLAFACSLVSFIGYGHLAFYGSFFFRNHGAQLAELAGNMGGLGPAGFLGTALGLIIGVFGAFGTWLGGQIADRAAKRDIRAYVSVPAVAGLLSFPFFISAMLSGSAALALALLALPVLLGSLWYGPVFAAVQSLVRPQTRATAAAVLLFVINLIGLGLGPLLVGLLSDYLTVSMGEGEGVRWALILSSTVGIIASLLFWLARKTIREEIVS